MRHSQSTLDRASGTQAGTGAARQALGSLFVFVVTIALLECALWVISARSKAVRVLLAPHRIQPLLPDPVMGVRLNPDLPDHDSDGFRNASVIRSPDVVALGDSQTYGANVARAEAWPQQLAALSAKQVYNMGVDGYGPVQELLLMKHAVTLHPRQVIQAFYSGNDLYDAFNIVYTRNQVTDLRSTDPAVLSTIDEAEKRHSLNDTVNLLFQFYLGNFSGYAAPAPAPPRAAGGLRHFLSEHSKLWGMLRATRRALQEEKVHVVSGDALWAEKLSIARKSGGKWIPFQRGQARTILFPEYRLPALNLEDPRIHEGLQVSVRAISRAAGIARKAGIHFTVLLIPTKQLVFFNAFGGNADPELRPVSKLAREETEMWTELKNDLRTRGISYIDALPSLTDSLRRGESPYPPSVDGHPTAHGQRAIALAVWQSLKNSRQ
jgi:hypothetical protein